MTPRSRECRHQLDLDWSLLNVDASTLMTATGVEAPGAPRAVRRPT